jgi:hypothetical protein
MKIISLIKHFAFVVMRAKLTLIVTFFEIRNLIASNTTLFIREDWVPGECDELYFNLQRKSLAIQL